MQSCMRKAHCCGPTCLQVQSPADIMAIGWEDLVVTNCRSSRLDATHNMILSTSERLYTSTVLPERLDSNVYDDGGSE